MLASENSSPRSLTKQNRRIPGTELSAEVSPISWFIQMTTTSDDNDPETALHAGMVAAAANNEEKSTCAQCGLPKSRRAYTDNDWIRGANGERKCLFSGSGKSDDEDCVSLIGHLGGCVSGIGYGIVGMVLLVFYLKFTLNPRFDRVRTYNKAVASWQEGLADEYASNWTSNAAQLPTLHLEQTVEDDDQSMNLTYTPAFHLETNTTFEQSLPHLDTPGDMNKYEAKTMVAATIENFHVATTPPSEGDGVLTVRIGAQNFTFATVRRTLNCGSVLRGLIFVFDDEVRKHECTPMYDNPAGVCYDEWSSLDPPQNIALRVEIRSPTDPVIVARDLFGCPSLYYSSPMWDPSERAAWRTVTILAYFVACSAVALFLFSRPGRWWFDDDDKTKSGGADRGGDVENVKVTDRLGGDVSAGATAAADAQPARGWFWSLSRRPEILR